MKKIIVFLVLLVFLFSSGTVNARLQAQIAPIPPYPPYQVSPGDYYKVMFDGEGEASVLAELNKLNTGREDLSSLEIEIPGKYVQLKYAFQRIGQYWENRFEPLDYQTEQLSKSTKYSIELNRPIAPGETGTVILYYKATGYAVQFVNFNFDFETIKSPDDTQYIRVAVSVDPDLYLRGGQVWTDYRSEFVGFGTAAKALTAGEAAPAQVEAFRGYSENIKHARGVVFEKRNLDPWESFHVTGCYNWGHLWFLTYTWELAGVLVLLVALKFLFWGRLRSLLKIRIRGKFPRVAAAGLGSAVATLVVWGVLFSFLGWMSRAFWHLGFFAPLLLIIFIVAVLAAFLALPILIARRYSLEEAGLTILAAVGWLFILLAIIAVLSIPPVILY